MRFLYIKNEQLCSYCQSTLSYGEEAVVIRIRHSNGAIIPTFFHIDQCYELWNKETFIRRLLGWRESAIERKKTRRKPKTKLGRPRKYTNSTQARRLLALAYYYRKVGKQDKVAELEDKLKELIKGS